MAPQKEIADISLHPNFPEARKKAVESAFQRIMEDPLKFINFSLTVKVRELWNRDNLIYFWSIGSKEREKSLKPLIEAFCLKIMNGAYRLIFLLFLIGIVIQIARPSFLMVLIFYPFNLLRITYFCRGSSQVPPDYDALYDYNGSLLIV